MNHPVSKLILISFLTLSFCSGALSQTLFTCGDIPVSKEDFLKAYNKNNLNEKPTEKSYQDYLELYIRYKLKVRAAYDLQLDTLPGQRLELQNFRSQVTDSYLKDDESLDKLTAEAFTRGQQDIHLAHIFIALGRNASPADTARAYEKAMGAWNTLKKGQHFGETALLWSEDPSVKQNKGDVGYITLFTLPYELETLAYSLKPGQFSRPYRSKGGFHIFKNLGERPAIGKIRAAQILVAFPPGADPSQKELARLKADSLFNALQKGADFASLAKAFSGDNLSYQAGGELPEFGPGKYDSVFEATAFSLNRDGAISRPVASIYGYHIIKRIQRIPFPRQETKETTAMLKQMVQSDARVEVSRKALYKRIYQQMDLRMGNFSEPELWAFTDSAMVNSGLSSYRDLGYGAVLFSFGAQTYTVKPWLDYARALRGKPGGNPQTDKAMFEKYLERSAMDRYRSHLEDYNKDFAFQLAEFREGNLLFEIMQRKIWDKASTDSAGLRNYYDSHKDKYWWTPSVEALLFTCNNEQTAQSLRQNLQRNPYDWRTITDTAGATVQADSGRYEWAQVPGLEKATPSVHTFTPMASNKTDNTVSFAYILDVYNGKQPRNYRDARGFVINDYQSFLEEKWIAELRKKYTVKVDDKVFKTLL